MASAQICVLGSANLDIVARVARLALPGETVVAQNMVEIAGGKGLNQAIAAARLGAQVEFIAAVGDDEAGRFLRAQLAREGVDTGHVLTRASVPTGKALIAVSDEGENNIIVAAGANATLQPHEILRSDNPDRVLLAQLEVPVAAAAAFFSQPGLKILNAAPVVDDAPSLFGLIDILIVNEVELAQLSGWSRAVSTREDFTAAARALSPRPRTVIVTRGGEGVFAVTEDKFLHVPGLRAQVLDTTGAGDCFCGALATALGEGLALEAAIGFANRAAAWSVTRLGASSSMPSRVQLEA